MKASTDPQLYMTAWYDTPFSSPINPGSPAQAERTPGCHVKSRALDDRRRWPRYFGRLSIYDKGADRAVVISKPPEHVDETPTVWEGSIREYHAMWECD